MKFTCFLTTLILNYLHGINEKVFVLGDFLIIYLEMEAYLINKDLLRFCGNTKKYINLAILTNILRLIFGIAFSYAFADIVYSTLEGKPINYWISLGLIVSIIGGKHRFIRLTGAYNFKIVEEVKLNLREAILKKVSSLGVAYRDRIGTQELIHNAVEGVEQLENYFGSYLTQLYYCLFSTIVLFIATAPHSMLAAILLLIASPVIPLFLMAILKMVKKSQRRYWKKYANVGNLFLDSLIGLSTLKIFKADKNRADEMDSAAEKFRKETMKLLAMQLNSMTIIDLVAYGSTAAAIIITLSGLKAGSVSVFGFILIIFLAAEFFVPMKQLTGMFHVAMTGAAAGEEILEFLNSDDFEKSGTQDFPQNADIELKDFSFSYENSNWGLTDIDIKFDSASLTALIGPSGCGKSTIASLISGQIYADSGIFYSGLPIATLKKGVLEQNVVRISHDGHIFAGSVRENLDIASSGIADENMIAVLKKLRLWEFLQNLGGLDTKLMSGGKNISGGQAQRIALARALLYEPEVYIFDEATSNIDIESEKIIIDTILDLAKSKTVIYISHKLDAVQSADKIYVIEDGKIVQEGIHSDLLRTDGLYKKIYDEQMDLISFAEGAAHE